jgi:arylsulfatase A-like enzyme
MPDRGGGVPATAQTREVADSREPSSGIPAALRALERRVADRVRAALATPARNTTLSVADAPATRAVVVMAAALLLSKVVCWVAMAATGNFLPSGWARVFAARDEAAMIATVIGCLWGASLVRWRHSSVPVVLAAHVTAIVSLVLAAACAMRGALLRWELLAFVEWKQLGASIASVLAGAPGIALAVGLVAYVVAATKLPVSWIGGRGRRGALAVTCVLYATAGTFVAPSPGARELTWAPLITFLRPAPLSSAWGSSAFVAPACPVDLSGPHVAKYEPVLVAARSQSPLNVLVFFWESVRAQNLSLYGYKRPTTPFLDSVASRSLVFDGLYAHDPRTIRALTSFLLGVYPETTWEAVSWHHPDAPGPDLAGRFRDAGWATLLVYNSSLKFDNQGEFLRHRGFDTILAPEQGAKPDDRAIVPKLASFLDRQTPSSKPFFGVLWGIWSHHPYRLPEGEPRPFDEQAALDRYDNAIVANDRLTREVVGLLTERNLQDRTVIVVVGDHGEAFGEHHGDAGGHGNYLYEESLRVPLVFLHPTLFKGLPRDGRLFQTKDLGASLLELAGLSPSLAQSRSVFRTYQRHPVFFNNRFGHHWVGVRDGEWKLVVDRDDESGTTRSLYALDRDPDERVNLILQEPARASALEVQLRQWYLWNEQQASERMRSLP